MSAADGWDRNESKLCPHGRLATAFCEPCGMEVTDHKHVWTFGADDTGYDYCLRCPAKRKRRSGNFEEKSVQPDGSDAKYYDFPEGLRTTMDLIEWLNLDFSNGNILKSLVREHNPDAKKETTALYEAQKRVYYAERNLRRVSKMQEEGAAGE